jgi:hypothetical protein
MMEGRKGGRKSEGRGKERKGRGRKEGRKRRTCFDTVYNLMYPFST